MEKEFVPYELALKLKELGFKEECMGLYEEVDNNIKLLYADPVVTLYLLNTAKHEGRIYHCKSPLWQQAFDWFREEKDLLNHLTTHLNTWGEDGALETYYGYRIMIDKDGWKCDVWEKLSKYETYEEARQACLEKLIEIVEK